MIHNHHICQSIPHHHEILQVNEIFNRLFNKYDSDVKPWHNLESKFKKHDIEFFPSKRTILDKELIVFIHQKLSYLDKSYILSKPYSPASSVGAMLPKSSHSFRTEFSHLPRFACNCSNAQLPIHIGELTRIGEPIRKTHIAFTNPALNKTAKAI
ncbi:Hypothetical predicted protein [Octopus vulgaris]|uniref:Uncharacterized protein n=1 Tax=Octopus vulgaris TaxID=6645 RepID=A0AA36FAW2_OCTVU|nr:Hypothetical predicted protein [Octopus vulgaris]